MKKAIELMRRNKFLFEELVKRDFKQKYKRTALGMVWSILNPLLTLLVMRLVFTQFFGRNTPHYTYFKESTLGGMNSLMSNAHIFTKIIMCEGDVDVDGHQSGECLHSIHHRRLQGYWFEGICGAEALRQRPCQGVLSGQERELCAGIRRYAGHHRHERRGKIYITIAIIKINAR